MKSIFTKQEKKRLSIFICTVLACATLTACQSTTASTDTTDSATETVITEATTVYGQITAINGNEITIAEAEVPTVTTIPDATATTDATTATDATATTDATAATDATATTDATTATDATATTDATTATDVTATTDASGAPALPTGEAPSDNSATPGTPPGGFSENITLTGEETTITVTDATVFTIDGETATIDDLQVDDIVTVTMDSDTVVSIEVGMSGGTQAADTVGTGSTSGTEAIDTAADTEVSDTQSISSTDLTGNTADSSVIMTTDGGNLTLDNVTITKSGDSSSTENSEFYGLNAAVLAKTNSTLNITNSSVTTDASGGNAIFATGENALINASNVEINTTGDSSRGLDATYGGTIIGDNVVINTAGAHCAALATDRGEGTVTVTNSALNTAGEGSPLVYSTGNISVSSTTGSSTGSSIAVVEGKNTITLQDCIFDAYAIGRATGGIDDAGVMIYQSFSGDAASGTGTFSATDSFLTIDEESPKYETSPMFFATNTDAVINLSNTVLNFGSGVLLSATGNDGEWGTAGSNGATVVFNAADETLEGKITADAISEVTLNLVNSTLKSEVNTDNTAKSITVNLDADSTWTVTGDSYVTILTDETTDCSNIKSNGFTIYYDSSNSANSWLDGKTITLNGGGSLKPM